MRSRVFSPFQQTVIATALLSAGLTAPALASAASGQPGDAGVVDRASGAVPPTEQLMPGEWTPGEGLPDWTIRFEPSMGFFSVSGDFEFPGGGGLDSTVLSFEDVNMDSPRISPMGELHLSRGASRLTIEGTGVSTTRETFLESEEVLGGVRVAEGERIRFSLEYETGALLVSHRVISRASTLRMDGVPDAAFGFDVVGGLRFHRVDANVAPVGGFAPGLASGASTVSVDEVFAEPVIGTRVELTLDDSFTLENRIEVGGMSFGDRSSVSGNLVVSFTYRPDPRIGIQTGYRLQVVSLSSGSGDDRFEWSGAMAGLFWGVSLSF